MRPARGTLLVRPVETANTFIGGSIVIPDIAKQRLTAHQCEVVEVGAKEICEDADCERDHVEEGWIEGAMAHPSYGLQRGDWLLVRPRCYVDMDDPTGHLRLIRQDDVLAVLHED